MKFCFRWIPSLSTFWFMTVSETMVAAQSPPRSSRKLTSPGATFKPLAVIALKCQSFAQTILMCLCLASSAGLQQHWVPMGQSNDLYWPLFASYIMSVPSTWLSGITSQLATCNSSPYLKIWLRRIQKWTPNWQFQWIYFCHLVISQDCTLVTHFHKTFSPQISWQCASGLIFVDPSFFGF